jgi:hypothetical protein
MGEMVLVEGLDSTRRSDCERLSGGHELSTDAHELRWLVLPLLALTERRLWAAACGAEVQGRAFSDALAPDTEGRVGVGEASDALKSGKVACDSRCGDPQGALLCNVLVSTLIQQVDTRLA